jgi:hypothetical protein
MGHHSQGSLQSEEITTISFSVLPNAATDDIPPPPLSPQAMPVAEPVRLGGGFGGGYVPPPPPPPPPAVQGECRG